MSEPANTQDTAPGGNKPPSGARGWLRRYLALPTIVVAGAMVYIAFFSEKSVTSRMAYQRVIDSLEICLRQQTDSLEYYRDLNRRLSTDPALMEQVVREQYNMKRQNEDVYVVE